MSAGRSRGSTVPLDLILILLYLGLVNGLLMFRSIGAPGSVPRIFLTVPLLLFVPGYALAAAAFPGVPRSEQRGSLLDRMRTSPSSVDSTERAALGFGLSLVLLPIVGVLVGFAGSFTTERSVVALSVVAAFLTLVAALRRWRLPGDERYAPPVGYWAAAVDRSTEGSETDVLLSVALGLSVVLALAAGGFALAAPQDGQRFTTFGAGHIGESDQFVLGPDETLREDLPPGEPVDSAFYVKNDEQRPVEYTVVVQVQRVNDDGDPVEANEINRYRQTLEPGQEWIYPHQVTPRMQGDDVRITYLLYKDSAPGGATVNNADEVTFHAINVSGGDD